MQAWRQNNYSYVHESNGKGAPNEVPNVIGKAGADFKTEFTIDTYERFFAEAGYTDVSYNMCKGRVPCAVSLLRKN